MSTTERNSFVVVANRLPVDVEKHNDGSFGWTTSPGGLVAALTPVLEAHNGCWVGWPGIPDFHADAFCLDKGIRVHPVELTADDYENFYEGFCNATLWPLYHDLIVTPEYRQDWWEAYQDVNERFAAAVCAVADQGATVWVQDYQLQLVPGLLRDRRPDLTIGFFLHIPFPSPDLFRQLPWRSEILHGITGADLVGCHLEKDALNICLLAASQELSAQPDEEHYTVQKNCIITAQGRHIGVDAFPISIDTPSLAACAESAESAAFSRELRTRIGDPDIIMLGVDRMDYTKGILQRLEAFEALLESGQFHTRDVVLIQIATPSRERISDYRKTRLAVEATVSRINGLYGDIGHPVVHYIHRQQPKKKLAYYYAAADIMLVTALKDGMNLVAKEYVACHSDGSGALVISEFAGAAHELEQAFICNPFDTQSIQQSILDAIDALASGSAQPRMRALNTHVKNFDVHYWANNFLKRLAHLRHEHA